MHPDSQWPAQSLPCNQSLNKPLGFLLTLNQLLGRISTSEALPHLKNKSGFKIDVVDDNAGCGNGEIHHFLAAAELRKHFFPLHPFRVYSPWVGCSSCSCLACVSLIFQLKGEADHWNSIKWRSSFPSSCVGVSGCVVCPWTPGGALLVW